MWIAKLLSVFVVVLFGALLCTATSYETERVVYKDTSSGIVVADNVFNETALSSYTQLAGNSMWQFDHFPGVVKADGRPSTAYVDGGFSRFVPYAQSGRKEDFIPIVRATRKFVEKHLKSSVEEDSGKETRVAVVRSSVRERILAAGDFVPQSSACANESTHFAIVVLTKQWTKNDYGDIALYDDTTGEIIQSFHPRFARLHLMRCDAVVKITPPSIDTLSVLHLLLFEITILPKDMKKPRTPEVEHETVVESGDYMEANYNKTLKFLENPNAKEHVVKDLLTTSGKRIVVFEDVFPEDYVKLLYDYHKAFRGYQISDISYSSDNVKWVLGSAEANFSSTTLWKVLQTLLIFVAGDNTHVHYDVTCNHITRGDNTIIHKDCAPGEKEYTMLIYLNPNLKTDDYGETVFFSDDKKSIDFVLAPKFGRIVVFEGTIPHSARPLAHTVEDVRFTYAVKTTLRAKQERKLLLDPLADRNVSELVEEHIEKLRTSLGQFENNDRESVPLDDLRFLHKILAGNDHVKNADEDEE